MSLLICENEIVLHQLSNSYLGYYSYLGSFPSRLSWWWQHQIPPFSVEEKQWRCSMFCQCMDGSTDPSQMKSCSTWSWYFPSSFPPSPWFLPFMLWIWSCPLVLWWHTLLCWVESIPCYLLMGHRFSAKAKLYNLQNKDCFSFCIMVFRVSSNLEK